MLHTSYDKEPSRTKNNKLLGKIYVKCYFPDSPQFVLFLFNLIQKFLNNNILLSISIIGRRILNILKLKSVSMKTKTILGISFTTVFVLSTISAITTIQADSMFKIRHLPDFKTSKSENFSENPSDYVEKIEMNLNQFEIGIENSLKQNKLKN